MTECIVACQRSRTNTSSTVFACSSSDQYLAAVLLPAGSLKAYERAIHLHRAKQQAAAAKRAEEQQQQPAEASQEAEAAASTSEPLTPEYHLPAKLLNNAAVRRGLQSDASHFPYQIPR